jgi:hypothetical protein
MEKELFYYFTQLQRQSMNFLSERKKQTTKKAFLFTSENSFWKTCENFSKKQVLHKNNKVKKKKARKEPASLVAKLSAGKVV